MDKKIDYYQQAAIDYAFCIRKIKAYQDQIINPDKYTQIYMPFGCYKLTEQRKPINEVIDEAQKWLKIFKQRLYQDKEIIDVLHQAYPELKNEFDAINREFIFDN